MLSEKGMVTNHTLFVRLVDAEFIPSADDGLRLAVIVVVGTDNNGGLCLFGILDDGTVIENPFRRRDCSLACDLYA